MTLSAADDKLRAQGIGASEIASILGVCPWRTAMNVWVRLREPQPRVSNAHMDWGHPMERALVEWYEGQHPDRACVTSPTRRDRIWDWALATPDRFVFEGPDAVHRAERAAVGLSSSDVWLPEAERLVECKNVGFYARQKWIPGSEPEVPDYVVAQVLWQMRICRVHQATVVVCLAGDPPVELDVPWDEELAGQMFQIVEKFWVDNVVGGEPPAPDGGRAWEEYLARRYPRVTRPEPLEAPELDAAVAERLRLKMLVKDAERQISSLEQEICSTIGECDAAVGPWGRATWRMARGKVSWKDYAGALGATAEGAEAHRGEGGRQLRVTLAKGGGDE